MSEFDHNPVVEARYATPRHGECARSQVKEYVLHDTGKLVAKI